MWFVYSFHRACRHFTVLKTELTGFSDLRHEPVRVSRDGHGTSMNKTWAAVRAGIHVYSP